MVLHFVMPIFYLTGFGLRVSPGGAKAFFVQWRTGEVCHTGRNRKRSLGQYPGLTPGAARRRAKALLGRTRDGRVPSVERARARGLPRVGEAMEAWLATRNIRDTSLALYRRSVGVWLKGWLGRRLDEVTREDVARRFAEVTGRHGRVKVNLGLFVLGGAYRRSAIDHPGLRNPVERWKLAGGRTASGAGVSSTGRCRCRRGSGGAARGCAARRLATSSASGCTPGCAGVRCWGFAGSGCRSGGGGLVDETKGGEPLELPVTRQLAAFLARWWEARPQEARWVFASPDNSERPLRRPDSQYRAIARHGGKPFWYHALRNCFVTVAAHELKLPDSLVKRLVNHRLGLNPWGRLHTTSGPPCGHRIGPAKLDSSRRPELCR